jgi:hypothetical protein
MADFVNFANLVARYDSSLPTLSDGEANALQVDVNGRLLVAADVSVELDHTDGDSVQIGDGTDIALVTAAGELNVLESNSANILTALELLDNAVFAVGTAAGGTDGGYNVLAIRDDALAALADPEGDYVSLRVNANGALWVKQDGDVNVTATSLDIRQLLHSGGTPDSVQIGDGTETLAINADGSINVQIGASYTENDVATDPTGDGIIQLTAGPDVVVSQAVAAGETFRIHGWNWASDRQCIFRLEVYDGAVLVEILRTVLNSGAIPSDSMNFGEPINIAGAATRVVRIAATRLEGANGNAAGGINATLD